MAVLDALDLRFVDAKLTSRLKKVKDCVEMSSHELFVRLMEDFPSQ
jgi:hypothetical protein